MDMPELIRNYREWQKKIAHKVPQDIIMRWNDRVIGNGLHLFGEKGAEQYLKDYGNGIGEKKVVHLAILADREGYPEVAMAFWKKAYDLSLSTPTASKTTKKKSVVKNQIDPVKVLFLASNPRDTERLRLSQEIRDIDQAMRMSQYRDSFIIDHQWAVRSEELADHLLRYKPDIVHFSGHGSKVGEIILEDRIGGSRPVSAQALSKLFSLFSTHIRCVVLNACYSEIQATAIAQHVDCVIGMSRAIEDRSAIAFASAFYRALAYGESLARAFEFGCVQIELQDLEDPDTPKIISTRINPMNIVFVKP